MKIMDDTRNYGLGLVLTTLYMFGASVLVLNNKDVLRALEGSLEAIALALLFILYVLIRHDKQVTRPVNTFYGPPKYSVKRTHIGARDSVKHRRKP